MSGTLISCTRPDLRSCDEVNYVNTCSYDCFCSEYNLSLQPSDCKENEVFAEYNIKFTDKTTKCYGCIECQCESLGWKKFCGEDEFTLYALDFQCPDCETTLHCVKCLSKFDANGNPVLDENGQPIHGQNEYKCAGSQDPCCDSPDPISCCEGSGDPCCGNSSIECNPCGGANLDLCCGSEDPCCGKTDGECDPCKANPSLPECDPCKDSTDKCCGSTDKCCASEDECCGSEDQCCGNEDPCCGVEPTCENGCADYCVCHPEDTENCIQPCAEGDLCCHNPSVCGCPDESQKECDKEEFCNAHPDVCEANNGEPPNNLY
jgi:hypothetical protein